MLFPWFSGIFMPFSLTIFHFFNPSSVYVFHTHRRYRGGYFFEKVPPPDWTWRGYGMNFSFGMVIQPNDRIGSPEIWTFQHNRWLTGGTCCFGLGRAPQNVGLNFHENLKIVKKFWKFAPKLIRGCWIRIWKPFFIKVLRWPVLRGVMLSQQ